MKKQVWAVAAAIAMVSFCACSDDKKDDFNFTINNGVSEVTINRLGGSVEIPIEASGEWTASISENEFDNLIWSDIRQNSGNGNTMLTVDVDYFSPSYQIHERNAKITVNSGNKSQVITVRQYVGIEEGESVPNVSSGYNAEIWHDKGLGKGLDPLTGNLMNNYVLNITNVIKLAEKPDYSTLFTQETRPGMNVDVLLNDTLENNLDSLGVSCNINVKFAKFKLGLSVDYHNMGKQVDHAATYTGSQDLEFLKANTSASDIAFLLASSWDDENQRWYKDSVLYRKVLSNGFLGVWADIMSNRDDEQEFNEAIDYMLEHFGPVWVVGSTLGGSIFTAIEYDSTSVEDDFKVNGKVTCKVMLAAIQIDGNITAGYAKKGKDIWEKSHFYCSLSGGDQKSYSAVLEQMNKPLPDRDALRTAARLWMESIRSSNDRITDNTALINVDYTGIWNLFPRSVANKIKRYILQKYEGQNMCVNLKSMGTLPVNK